MDAMPDVKLTPTQRRAPISVWDQGSAANDRVLLRLVAKRLVIWKLDGPVLTDLGREVIANA